jgi:hypothetical protein
MPLMSPLPFAPLPGEDPLAPGGPGAPPPPPPPPGGDGGVIGGPAQGPVPFDPPEAPPEMPVPAPPPPGVEAGGPGGLPGMPPPPMADPEPPPPPMPGAPIPGTFQLPGQGPASAPFRTPFFGAGRIGTEGSRFGPGVPFAAQADAAAAANPAGAGIGGDPRSFEELLKRLSAGMGRG